MLVEHVLDVSHLEPCEPLERALAALATLPVGEYLKILHRMEPYPLYQILSQQGFAWRTQPGKTTPVEILIWHREDDATE